MTMHIEMRKGHFSNGDSTHMFWITEVETGDVLCVNSARNILEQVGSKPLADWMHYYAAAAYQAGRERLEQGEHPVTEQSPGEPHLMLVHGPLLEAGYTLLPKAAQESRKRYLHSYSDALPLWTATFDGSLLDDLDELQARSPDDLEGWHEQHGVIH